MSNPCWVIIPAAGVGSRMQATLPKQYLALDGGTVLSKTVECFLAHPRVTDVMVVHAANDKLWQQQAAGLEQQVIAAGKQWHAVTGGAERSDSVLNALESITNKVSALDWMLVHDAARPCLHQADLDKLIKTLDPEKTGGLLAAPVRDTLKRSDSKGQVLQTIDRSELWQAFTPQMFRFDKLYNALKLCQQQGVAVTDDASAIEYAGDFPVLVQGRYDNIKITLPEDILLAQQILLTRQQR